MKKEKKSTLVGVRLNDSQVKLLDKLIDENELISNRSQAIQYLINKYIITQS